MFEFRRCSAGRTRDPRDVPDPDHWRICGLTKSLAELELRWHAEEETPVNMIGQNLGWHQRGAFLGQISSFQTDKTSGTGRITNIWRHLSHKEYKALASLNPEEVDYYETAGSGSEAISEQNDAREGPGAAARRGVRVNSKTSSWARSAGISRAEVAGAAAAR